MQIIVSDKWLKACGKSHLSGKALEVTKVKDFGSRGKFYTVTIPNANLDWFTQWEIWSIRGVTEIN